MKEETKIKVAIVANCGFSVSAVAMILGVLFASGGMLAACVPAMLEMIGILKAPDTLVTCGIESAIIGAVVTLLASSCAFVMSRVETWALNQK